MKYLYKITNQHSGTIYYGITNNIKQRMAGHKHSVKAGKKTPLYDAMRRYGFEEFKVEVLEKNEDSTIIADKEIEMIANSATKTYNLHLGGSIGFDIRTKGAVETEKWKAKLVEKRKGKTPALGMKHTDKIKALCGTYGKLRWDIYGRYPQEVLNYGFTEANKLYGISKTHYYRLRKAATQ